MTSASVSVYVAERVRRTSALHEELLSDYPGGRTVLEVLEAQARRLLDAHRAGNAASCFQLDNWHPRFVGRSEELVLSSRITLADARLAVAREHGFEDWKDALRRRGSHLDEDFERAASAVVYGRLEELVALLHRHSDLVRRCSAYGHRATLLHYVAANGVETWRQRVPSNAVLVAESLLGAGADRTAEARMYGGGQTTLALLVTSAHPARAGVAEALSRLLRSGAEEPGGARR